MCELPVRGLSCVGSGAEALGAGALVQGPGSGLLRFVRFPSDGGPADALHVGGRPFT
jgi:hypothetical protein